MLPPSILGIRRFGDTILHFPAIRGLLCHSKPRPAAPGGAWVLWSVAVRGAGARPDQIERLAIITLEQAGEDRGVEAGIIELDRKIVAVFLADLEPGCSDFCRSDEYPVRRGVFVFARFFGNDGDVLLLQAHRDDFALILVAGLFECANVCGIIYQLQEAKARICRDIAR
jgi:hypothetical protein